MPSLNPRVCVLLSSFNGAEFIEQQISSILGQCGVSVVVYVRDDGSSDSTEELLVGLAERESRLRFVHDTQCGATGSPTRSFFRLFGLVDFSEFDYVALSDQDDIWLPDKLIGAISALIKEEADGYSSDLLSFYENGACRRLRKSSAQKRLDYLFQGASAGCTYVLSKQFAVEVGSKFGDAQVLERLPSLASHDWLLYALCRGHGRRWTMGKTVNILYRQHSSNVYGAQSGLAGLVSRWRLALSGWYFKQVLFLSEVVPSTPEHQRVFSAIRRFSIADRVWLAFNSVYFRRTHRDVLFLAIFFLVGRRPV
jgi:rhamnosyltransferase